MKKVETLTAEQEAQLPLYLNKWLQSGYSTAPIDRVAAKEQINWLYKEFLQREAPIFFYCQSPFQALATINLLRSNGFQELLKTNLRDNLRANLGANLWDNLWDKMVLSKATAGRPENRATGTVN